MKGANDQLSIALSRLELLPVARALGFELKAGVQSRPGRDAEKKPSFSVFAGKAGGLVWKDHSEGDGGGVWQFVCMVHPEWSKKQVAEWLIGQAGLDPKEGQLSNRGLRADLTRRRTEAAEKYFKEPMALPELPSMGAMAAHVRERYGAGWKGLGQDAERRLELAEQRGWPVDWVDDLQVRGLLADPVLPWMNAGEKGAQRGFSFLVQLPKVDGKGRVVDLVSVGYHQRFRTAEGHSWIFCPHRPKRETRTEYDKAMESAGQIVAPLPFVMGDPEAGLWVILEGQWDAASFWYVWQAFGDGEPVFVVGIRGAQGTGVFLSAWARVLARVRPRVWCITDNDAAGKRWAEAKEPGHATDRREWTFVDLLREWGAARVAHARMRVSAGKDFNDWLKVVGNPQDAAARVRANYKQFFPEETI